MKENSIDNYKRSRTEVFDKWLREDEPAKKTELRKRDEYQVKLKPTIKRISKTYHLDPATVKSLDDAAEKYGTKASRLLDQIVEDLFGRKEVIK